MSTNALRSLRRAIRYANVGSLLVALALPAHAQQASDAASEALAHYERGVALYSDGHDFAGAYREAQAALALAHSPNARLLLARCLRQMGRIAESAREFERVEALSNDPAHAETRDLATREIASIEPQIAHVTVRVPSSMRAMQPRVVLNGVALSGDDLDAALAVMPGHVVIDASAEGYRPFHREADVSATQRIDVEIALHIAPRVRVIVPATPTAPRPLVAPTIGAAVTAVGGAALVAWPVLWFATDSYFQSISLSCRRSLTQTCSPMQEMALPAGETLEILTNVAIGVGFAGVVAGGVLLLLAIPRARPAPAIRASAGLGSFALSARF